MGGLKDLAAKSGLQSSDFQKPSMRPKPSEQTTLEPYIRAATPFVVAAANIMDALGPYLETAWNAGCKVWDQISPYKDDWMPIVLGLLLIFFGGSLPLTIAAIESFRLCGWEKTKVCLMILHDQYKLAAAASKKDDDLDENNDGIADVKQISKSELLTRKMKLFAKVSDPVKLQEGINGVVAGSAAVVAALRMKFARTVALGTALGDIFTSAADKVLRPSLERIIPPEDHKWIPMTLSYGCRAAAVWMAWWLQRVISAFHCSVRGSDQLLNGLLMLAHRYNFTVPMGLSPSHAAYPPIVAAVSAFGFYWQCSRFFGLPFPFNILLLPLRVVEGLLAWFVFTDT
uniref:Uncharacterized protein n=1 Tax=Chlamydomonas euryale TaxID=1486919 RepID=A0A7R9YT47_9CHLO